MSTDKPAPHHYARPIFLAVSAVVFTAFIIVGRAVMLPFLLAILVAYVLFPAVRLMERIKIPRAAAILLVYGITLGGAAAFGSAVVPRLFEETKKLSAELPRLTRHVRDHWLPAIDARLQRWSGVDPAALAAREQRERASARQQAARAPIIIKPLEDGSFEVHLLRDVELRKRSESSWLVTEAKPTPAGRALSARAALGNAFDRAMAYVKSNSLELLALGRAIVTGVSRGIFYFFLTLMIAGYLMYTYERIHRFAREMWPEPRRPAFDRFLHRLDRGMAGVVRGQLIICVVNGALSAIVFKVFGLHYWPILALIASIMSIIPIFGSILSSIPAVAIGLTQDLTTAVAVLLGVVAIHQLEANFLNPKIIGDQAKIHPVLVVFALLLGEHFYQITGALLAVPCLALAQTVFLHFRESVLGLPASRTSFFPPPWMHAEATAGAAGAATAEPPRADRPVDEAPASPTQGSEPPPDEAPPHEPAAGAPPPDEASPASES